MKKTIVTHVNPHLDDIAAIWLFKKFFPDFTKAQIKFISANEGKRGLLDTSKIVHIGVGMGRFDEHKGDLEDSSMSLVWKEIKKLGLAGKNSFESQALKRLVEWNTLIDTAKLPYWEFDDFNIESFIRSYDYTDKGNEMSVELGKQILDRILLRLIKREKNLIDWKKRREFKSRWGKAIAISSPDFDTNLAYKKGFVIVVQVNPKNGFVGISAPAISQVDLTPIYLKLQKIDPQADWFLHHAKKLLLCGSPSAPSVCKTKLSPQQLIDIIQSC